MELRAESITASAYNWLQTSSEPRILHLFSATINLVNERDEVASVVAPGLDRTAFSIRLRHPLAAEREGGFAGLMDERARVAVDGDRLNVGPVKVMTGEAQEWDPSPDWDSLRAGAPAHADLERLLSAALQVEAPPGGLADLWAERDAGARDESLLRRAAPAARALQHSVRVGHDAPLSQAASGLAGLGGGLTPSGDDLLVGAIHAFYLRLERSPAQRTSQLILDSAAGRTTLISRAWLGAAARGEASEGWHRLLAALSTGEAPQIRGAATRLLKMGHTSGADGLAGFLLTDQALASKEPKSDGGVSTN